MIYLARTSEGVIAIDLGWWGSERALQGALRELDATRNDIAMVFLTHTHRDHIAAWRSVRHAPFYVASDEYSRLVGDSAHRGWVPRLGRWVKPVELPHAGDLDVRTFARDTAFVVGSDTMRAYVVAGHTAGTTVYLFRGVLFLGDAVTYSRWRGFAPPKPRVSDNPRLAAENLALLWPRLPPGGVRYVCTAHAHCAPFSARVLADVAR
jgi:glyoxylase-like metal-dependent hydrolase (beta-lactamase superfamily II)